MQGCAQMELSPATFLNLRDLIYERSGIFFQENKKYLLEGRLQARIKERNCASYEEYYNLLKFDAWRDKELSTLFNLVTTNETFFYRDLAQLQTFMEMIVPATMKANAGTSSLKIWSAAASTGDEAYTLGMMLLEHPPLAKWSIEILATDISEATLNLARKAVYGEYAVRNIPPALLQKYFTVLDGQYVLSAKVKHLVKLANMNLYDSARLKMVRGMDVIFCRNCLIYFDEKAKKKILDNLYDCLSPNGHLVVGFSESLHNITRAFRPLQGNRAVVYQKL
ncbi:MAG: protein-glutamate O-methyltransferase CheR [Nitrospirae bacterium]|nr:MAG: protein-glutamate O-methyltransferase CheR [Nitrospirota bacterium]